MEDPGQNQRSTIKRIFLECTSTYQTGLTTGIQRVVRNLCRESTVVGSRKGVVCQPVILRHGHLYAVSVSKTQHLGSKAWSLIKEGYWRCASAVHAVFPSPKLRRLLLPEPGHRGIFKIPSLIIDRFCETFLWRRVQPEQDDMLLLLDASWGMNMMPVVTKAKKHGARIGAVVYDLIPITHPQFFPSAFADPFHRWLRERIAHCDFFVAISETVCRELARHLPPGWEPSRVRAFPLGATLDEIIVFRKPRAELKAVFDDTAPTFLTVGTLEPRKNHSYLLDAFESVWEQGCDARLCIVGRVGWKCDDTVQRIRNHPLFKSKLFLFNDLTDSELRYCYQHARALVYPSFIEGFGLPLVEALRHHRLVLASDIPIHREVCGEFAAYFDLDAPDALTKQITELVKNDLQPPVRDPREYPLFDWRASCDRFLATCLELAASSRVPRRDSRVAA
jgi:alpha-1,2-rhamnosyltransferase